MRYEGKEREKDQREKAEMIRGWIAENGGDLRLRVFILSSISSTSFLNHSLFSQRSENWRMEDQKRGRNIQKRHL